MAVEIEAKIKVDNLEPVRARLRKLGARHKSHRLELNTFFDTNDGSLVAADKGLRIRRNRDLRTRKETLIITFKGPRHGGSLKSRDEFELEVDSYDDTIALFEALGYRPTLSFEKRRESWTLGKCLIELDELPRLGTFVEVEGPNAKLINALLARLELDHNPIVKDGYATLLANLPGAKPAKKRIRKFNFDRG
jgi:adenylate cyclase, class 2